MAKTYTIKMDGMEFTAPTQAEAMAMAQEFVKSVRPTTTTVTEGKGKPKTAVYVKADGTKVPCTEAQKQVWEKWADGSADRKASKEANLKKFEADRKGYKPSQALIDAIKKDRASITRKVAKEQFGFVGTKDDLKALKEKVCK